MAYGRRIDTLQSQTLKTRQRLVDVAHSILAPGACLADSFPILASLPDFLAPWKKEIRASGNEHTQFNIDLVDVVRADLEKSCGKGVGSMTETMLRLKEQRMLGYQLPQDRHLSSVPATLFGADADTTSAALHSAILALMTHPQVLSIARSEIDAVVGSERRPTLHDSVPYCEALIREVLRWRPVAPLVLSHATTEADTYEGWIIPKGTLVIVNTMAVNKHGDHFPFPEKFAPERYLHEKDCRYRPELKGKDLPALASLRIADVKIIWEFEILKLEGEKYDVDAYEGDVVLKRTKFRCGFRVRSEEHRNVIEREFGDAEKVLEKFLPFD